MSQQLKNYRPSAIVVPPGQRLTLWEEELLTNIDGRLLLTTGQSATLAQIVRRLERRP